MIKQAIIIVATRCNLIFLFNINHDLLQQQQLQTAQFPISDLERN